MKETMKSALVSGSAFGAGCVIILSPGFVILAVVGHPIVSVALAGFIFAITGLPFGVAMALFGAYQRKRFLAMDLVPSHETLIHQGAANHFMGLEGVGGWLYLTDQALRFKSHQVNIQRHEVTIPVCEISEAIPCRTAGIFPNGLRVTTKDGRSERFVLNGRRKWSSAITRAKMDAEPAAPAAGNKPRP